MVNNGISKEMLNFYYRRDIIVPISIQRRKIMGTTQPIKDPRNIEKMKKYFIKKDEIRNYVMFILGLNTSLRISDLLHLKWKDVYNFKTGLYREHIVVIEQKTMKKNMIAINHNIYRSFNYTKEKIRRNKSRILHFSEQMWE